MCSHDYYSYFNLHCFINLTCTVLLIVIFVLLFLWFGLSPWEFCVKCQSLASEVDCNQCNDSWFLFSSQVWNISLDCQLLESKCHVIVYPLQSLRVKLNCNVVCGFVFSLQALRFQSETGESNQTILLCDIFYFEMLVWRVVDLRVTFSCNCLWCCAPVWDFSFETWPVLKTSGWSFKSWAALPSPSRPLYSKIPVYPPPPPHIPATALPFQ